VLGIDVGTTGIKVEGVDVDGAGHVSRPLLAFDAAVHSSAGPRPENQDSALAGCRLVALADGVGGNVGGAIASALVTSWLAPLDGAALGLRPGPSGLRQVVAGANARLAATVDTRPWLRTMATTLVTVLADEMGLSLAYIGDSRVYLLREDRLVQVTADQTFVQTLVDRGYITPAEAAVHPQRSWVYAALQGEPADVDQLQIRPLEARAGDRLLLCSDGLSDVVPSGRLEHVLAESAHPTSAANRLVEEALEAAASDNVTVVVADVIEGPSSHRVGPVTVGAAAHPAAEVLQALEALWPPGPS
jgi:protein phosphatase